MKKILIIVTLGLASSLTHASDYTPKPGLSGAELFSEACASCHGDAGAGKFGILLKLAGTDLDANAIKATISSGGTLMPKYPNIQADDLNNLAAYIKKLPAK